jgi:hypothetical protein
MSTIVTDTITGKSTATTVTIGSTPVVSSSANSMTIRGEGSNQTSIQQGLLKSWIRFNGTGTIAINDNFNCSSITDNGTGDYTMTMQTAMANIHYSQTCGAADVDHGAKINISYSSANTTTAMRIRLAAAVSGNGDSNGVTNHVAGDLA